MKYRAILFDMDGTLLPMDMDRFTEGYFRLLAKRLLKFGVDPKAMVKAMWIGVGAMVKNDGARPNNDVFWDAFTNLLNVDREVLEPETEAFYSAEFHTAKEFTGENKLAAEAIRIAHEAAPIVALATNPIFPMVAQIARLSWIGLSEKDFDLVTAFETDYYSKPSIAYYESVCGRLNVKPEQCLMVGNDEGEDMYPASQLGMDCYLVTDSMIANEKHPWNGKRGTFAELVEYLKAMAV